VVHAILAFAMGILENLWCLDWSGCSRFFSNSQVFISNHGNL